SRTVPPSQQRPFYHIPDPSSWTSQYPTQGRGSLPSASPFNLCTKTVARSLPANPSFFPEVAASRKDAQASQSDSAPVLVSPQRSLPTSLSSSKDSPESSREGSVTPRSSLSWERSHYLVPQPNPSWVGTSIGGEKQEDPSFPDDAREGFCLPKDFVPEGAYYFLWRGFASLNIPSTRLLQYDPLFGYSRSWSSFLSNPARSSLEDLLSLVGCELIDLWQQEEDEHVRFTETLNRLVLVFWLTLQDNARTMAIHDEYWASLFFNRLEDSSRGELARP
ncbi:hypothetical protein BDY24DRAFT_419345, partial [Mrakia frigida]|uniref:uncharacterized protein n=1 Tax=Mrakia frigida TaxID=29902 RepID=UPI003FCC1309